MSDAQQFDILILGGGMSYVGAIRAAQLGLKVGLVERDRMGGTCLNRGCIPTKAMLETADLLHRVTEQGAEFGLAGGEGVTLDYPALGKRRDAVVEKHVKGVEFLMKKNNVTILRGSGTLTSPTSVHVSGGESGEVDASGTDLILATGSAPRSLPGLDVDGERIITSDEALLRETVPARVAIVGAGAIGVEWASLYSDLGAEVHLIEYLERIVPLEDADVSKELTRIFKKRNVKIYAASSIDSKSIERTKRGVHFAVEARDGKTRVEMETDVILVAVGRRPVTDGIGLEDIPGVEMERGFVKVNGFMQTGVPHLYAIGD
ncbi:MAG TPA: FAD-dependent oxidoreductase, partial [Candidatus Limnocylindria bacterium]